MNRCVLPLIIGSLLLPLGCGGDDDPTGPDLPVLQPSELCSDQPDDAIATFEDPKLEQAVRAQPGGGAQDLTCGLVSGLTTLAARYGAGIMSLVGIQNLTSLTTLILQGNEITDISPLSGLTGLIELFLDVNLITDISALSGKSLTDLTLYNNSITDISALSGLTSLISLELSNNSITDISALSGLTRLGFLFLSDNSITDISALSALTSLCCLDLSNNSITDISALSGLTRLDVVLLDGNPDLSNIQPLLDNPGLGPENALGPDRVNLGATNVNCIDVAALEAKGVVVDSDCP